MLHNSLEDLTRAFREENLVKTGTMIGPHCFHMEEPPLSSAESQALDEMLRQATLSAQLDDGLVLPWEQGVMSSILGDEPLLLDDPLPKINHSENPNQRTLDQVLEPAAKRARVVSATTRMYERAISFRNTSPHRSRRS